MERVQLNLERRLPEFADLERKKIFNKNELDDIAKRRREFETSLGRRGSTVSDWLRFIEYEKKIDRLRKLRLRRQRGTTIKKPTISDFSIGKKVLDLYKQALKRFSHSTSLWSNYINYALTTDSPKLVSTACASAISRHPTNPEFWILAARWESDGNEAGLGGGQFDAARKILLRGLRFNPHSTAMWRELVKCEIAFSDRLRARWQILGFDVTPPKDLNKDENKPGTNLDIGMLDNEQEQEEQDQQLKNSLPQDASGQKQVLDGQIVKLILDNAFNEFNKLGLESNLNNKLQIYSTMINFLTSVSSPLCPTLLEHVYSSLVQHWGHCHQGLYLIAYRFLQNTRFASSGLDFDRLDEQKKQQEQQQSENDDDDEEEDEEVVEAVSKSTKVYWEAYQDSSDKAEILEGFIQFLNNQILPKTRNNTLKKYVIMNINRIIQEESKLEPTRQFYIEKINFLQGQNDSSVGQAAQEATSHYPTSKELWLKRLQVDSQNSSSILTEALKHVPWSVEIWKKRCDLLESSIQNENEADMLFEALIRHNLLQSQPKPENKAEFDESRDIVFGRYVKHHQFSDNTQRLALYKKLGRFSPTPSMQFWKSCIESETDESILEHLYTICLQHPQTSVDNFLEHMKFILEVQKDASKAYDLLTHAKTCDKLDQHEKATLEFKWSNFIMNQID